MKPHPRDLNQLKGMEMMELAEAQTWQAGPPAMHRSTTGRVARSSQSSFGRGALRYRLIFPPRRDGWGTLVTRGSHELNRQVVTSTRRSPAIREDAWIHAARAPRLTAS